MGVSMRLRRWRWGLLLVVLLATAAHAQPRDTVSVEFRGAALVEALQWLADTGRLNLAYDPRLVARRRTTCVAEHVPSEEALRCVLRGTGVEFVRLSTGVYVLRETAAARSAPGTLRGRVVDAGSGLGLPDAHVLLRQIGRGVASGQAGQFAFPSLPAGAYEVLTSYVGYAPHLDTVHVGAGDATSLVVPLKPLAELVTPIVVEDLTTAQALPTDRAGRATADPLDAAAGLTDVTQRLTGLVGVRVSNITADVHVQGGAGSEHLLVLDGVPVFTPPVLAGLIGPFAPFAIGRISVQKAGHGVEPGSNMVGVIEAEHQLSPGRSATFDVQVDAYALNARLLGEGERPGKPRVRALAAGRVSLWPVYEPAATRALLTAWNRPDAFMRVVSDHLLATVPDTSSGDPIARYLDPRTPASHPSLGFADLHLAALWGVGKIRQVYASAYVGTRSLRTSDILSDFRDEFEWTSAMGQVRFQTFVGNRTFLRLQGRASLYTSTHEYVRNDRFGVRERVQPDDDGTQLYEVGLDARADHAITATLHLDTGLESTLTAHRFAAYSVRRDSVLRNQAALPRVASYAQLRLHAGAFELTGGVRATVRLPTGGFYPEPRLALSVGGHVLRGDWLLRLSGGRYRQFVNPYQVSNVSPRALVSSSRIWLALDPTVEPPSADHVAATASLSPVQGLRVAAESFYRHQRGLLLINYAARVTSPRRSIPQQRFMERAEGYAYGVAGYLEAKTPRTFASARLEYEHVERGTPRIFGGNYYVVPWNEPFRLTLQARANVFRSAVVLVRWQSIWGRAWAYRQAYYDFVGAYPQLQSAFPEAIGTFLEVQRDTHGLRFPATQELRPLHQLDVSVSYAWSVFDHALQLRADVLNALDRRNVAEWRLQGDRAYYEETGLLRPEERELLPLTVALALRLTV